MLASGRIRLLLLLGLCGWPPLGLRAQVSTPLAPPLGTKAETEPVSNLTFDLLVPQRPSATDPTGASILVNAMNPFVIAGDFSSATAQTDTALRDSTQSGRFNPYGLGSSRGSLLSGGGESDDAASMTVANRVRPGQNVGIGASGGPIVQTSTADYDPGYGAEPNSSYHSSWGTSSAFSSADASGWGVRATPVARMGRNTESSPVEDPLTASVGQARTAAAGMSGAANSAISGRSQSGFAATIGSRRGASSPPSQLGSAEMNPAALAGRAQSGAEASFGSRTSRRAGDNDILGGSALSGGMSGRAAATGGEQAPRTLEGRLLFSPRSYAGYSFGATPFSPPGLGQASFLNPNIFDTTPVTLSRRSSAGSRARRLYRQKTLGGNSGLATNSSKYGLGSKLASDRAGSHRRDSSAERLLNKSRAGTENPYKSAATR